MIRPLLSLILTLAISSWASARSVGEVYANFCAGCHGPELNGGSAPSLIDDVWTHGSDDESLARAIAQGWPDEGMPPFEKALSSPEIRALVVYLQEGHAKAARPPAVADDAQDRQTFTSREHNFRLEIVAEGLDEPWSIAWLPDGRMLITEKSGRLRLFAEGQLDPTPIKGIPEVYDQGQGGLLEVALHPHYADNGWIYLAYSDPLTQVIGPTESMTKIVRGRLVDHAWVDQQTIWQAPPSSYRSGGPHYGCRIAFDAGGYLFFSHGERGQQDKAQDLSLPNGKIYRVYDDGRIPADNPFVNTPGALPSIWSYGHRNPQGLAFEPATGLLWETEHGPRGGDELNTIRPKANYGWPVITFGMNYNGTPITALTAKAGMEPPVVQWTPSPAVCGIDFYIGDQFPRWSGNLFVTALAGQHLRRVVVHEGRVTDQEILLQGIGRVRDVANGPDGYLYLVLNRPGKIVRLVPVE